MSKSSNCSIAVMRRLHVTKKCKVVDDAMS